MAATFSVAEAPFRFPALNKQQVFLDNAGGSQVLGSVIDSIKAYLSSTNVQLGATYPAAQASMDAYVKGCKAGAEFINASLEEISIGVSTTQNYLNLATALAFEPSDEIVISVLNHEANTSSWVRIAKLLGLAVKWWMPKNPTNPDCDVETLKPLLSEKTRLVAFPHTSNITGTITNVRQIADVVHQFPRALVCVDGVALAPHRPVDVKELDADIYAFSWYKVYGPHIAQIYCHSRIHDQINMLGHYFKASEPQTLETKLTLASANYELTQSIPEITAYFGPDRAASWKAIADHEEKLQAVLLDYLRSNDKVTIIGEPSADQKRRVPVVSFLVKGWKSQAVVQEVEKRSNFGFRAGHMYSHRLLRDVLKVADPDDGVVRISFLHYNTVDEVKGLVDVLKGVLEG